MSNPLRIIEINKNIKICTHTLIDNEIVITNTSLHPLTNIKLTLEGQDFSILSQSLIRERGSMEFSPHQNYLEIGNLEPQESAYFEYSFSSNKSLVSLANNFVLTYTIEDNPNSIRHTISELLNL